MTIQSLGSLTVGGCIPLGNSANVALAANVNAQLPRIQTRLTGALAAQARMTVSVPSVQARIDALTAAAARLAASPVGSISVEGVTSAIAALEAEISALSAQLSLSASIGATFGTAGVWAYTATSTPGAIGTELDAEVGGGLPDSLDPSLPVYAVILIASDAGAITAMQAAFAG